MARTKYLYVDHGIGLDPEEPRDEEEMRCKSCADTSGTQAAYDVAQDWAMRHTGKTGHTSFRLVTTNHYLVKPL